MHRLQHIVPLSVNARNTFPCRRSPGQKNHTTGAHPRDEINHLLSKPFPTLIRMTVSLMSAHRQAGVEHQDAALGPWYQQPAFVWRCLERRIVVFDLFVDVDKRWGSNGWRTDGEG